MNMFGLKLKEGRTWNDKDQFAQYKMMINETARKLFRIKILMKLHCKPNPVYGGVWGQMRVKILLIR